MLRRPNGPGNPHGRSGRRRGVGGGCGSDVKVAFAKEH